MSKAASAPVLEAVGSPAALNRPAPMLSRESSWLPLPGTVTVSLDDLRNGMCRWPVNDPQHRGSFQSCGAECDPSTSYCTVHARLASAPTRSR